MTSKTKLLFLLFYAEFDAPSVFTGCVIGCTHILQLKNSLKFHFDEKLFKKFAKKECLRKTMVA